MEFTLIDCPNFRIFHFVAISENGVISLDDFKEFMSSLPFFPGDKGIIISGRGPIWVHTGLAHQFHPTKWIATLDPRLGAVVFSTHSTEKRIGEIIPLEEIRRVAPSLNL